MSAETWHLHMLFSVQTLESDDAVRNLACHEPGVVACAKLIGSLHSCEKYMEIRSSEALIFTATLWALAVIWFQEWNFIWWEEFVNKEAENFLAV